MATADLADTVQKFINSPPGQLVAGAALAGFVWKFFERVEAVLTEQTKFEVAVWLVGVRPGQIVEPWPKTFAKLFDRVFGTKHLSWRCFLRSLVASYASVFFVMIATSHTARGVATLPTVLAISFIANVLPDYGSLVSTRLAIGSIVHRGRIMLPLIVDFIITCVLALIGALCGCLLYAISGIIHSSPETMAANTHGLSQLLRALGQSWNHFAFWAAFFRGIATQFQQNPKVNLSLLRKLASIFILPAFFTSVWLWLYAASGFLLKAAHRFDVGFQWFNRKVDIEKKPLSAIGLVAGSLVAVVYWGFVLTLHVVHK